MKSQKENHFLELRALQEDHESHSEEIDHGALREIRSMEEDAVLKENRVKAAKYDLNEKICQDLVMKMKGLELELQKSLADSAESTSHAKVMERQVRELEAELVESEEISRNRQLAINDLTQKLKQASNERDRLAEQIDPQFMELLKGQLEDTQDAERDHAAEFRVATQDY